MRIAKVEAIPLFAPVDHERLTSPPFAVRHAERLGPVLFAGYGTTLVRITTDDGLVGVGECGSRMAPEVSRVIVGALTPLLIGENPLLTSVLWERMFSLLASAGHSKGYFVEALSGVDIALWDLKGKAIGAPVHQLLGGHHWRRLPAYATALTLSQEIEGLAARTQRFIEDGYTMAKAKMGANPDDPTKELAHLAHLVESYGKHLRFVVDANGVYGFRVALRVGRELDRLGVGWFEEPVPAVARADQAELARRLDTPIAGGEAEHTRFHFRDVVVAKAYDILQPNVARAGGITEVQRIVALCDAFQVGFSPHVGTSSAVCIAATLHVSAAAASFVAFEHAGTGWAPGIPNPFRSGLATAPLDVVEGGTVAVPTGPGLGIDLDEDVVERYRLA